MRRIPLVGGVILSDEEFAALCKKIVEGIFAKAVLAETTNVLGRTTTLGNALAVSLDSAIDYLQSQAQDDPAASALLDQIHAALQGAYTLAYPEEVLAG